MSLEQIDFNVVRQYNFPTSIRFGAGVIKELPEYLKSQALCAPLLVTDPVIGGLGFFKKIEEDLAKQGLSVQTFSDISKNPVKSDVLKGGDAYHASQRDCVIGIGGGAALDVARSIVLRINHTRDLFDYDDLLGGDKYVTEDVPHFVTVPTTAGTGSEVGRSAVISEDESKKKRVLFSQKLMARMVFADPMLTMELPPFITAATGMDALTHNMEAYLVNDFHPMCDGIALEGIALIAQSIEKATQEPDLESRSKMLLASLMGAVAFQKGLGIVHSMSHPMSSLLDTHHGLANAVNLPYGMKFNYNGSEQKFDMMALAFGMGANKGEYLMEHLFALNIRLGIPTKISAIDVMEEHIDSLAELATQDFCLPSNPKPVSKQDFVRLYSEAL